MNKNGRFSTARGRNYDTVDLQKKKKRKKKRRKAPSDTSIFDALKHEE